MKILRTFYFTVSFLGLVFLALQGSVADAASPQPLAPSAQGWTLQPDFSDEFNGQTLDLEKWKDDIGSWGTWSWKPQNVSINNGLLGITMKYQPHQRNGKEIYYTSGIVMSRKPILYGYFEARIKAAHLFPGVCPAFWAWHSEGNEWTEIDFVELTEHPNNPSLIDTNTHVFKHPGFPRGKVIHESRVYHAPWDPRADFHVYGCEWDANQIRWFIDGKLVATRANEYWHQPLDLTLSLGLRPPLSKHPDAAGLPTTFYVDYVRVWKKGAAPAPRPEPSK